VTTYAEDVAFARVEIHLPDVGPGKEGINISLESRAIRWIFDCAVQNAIVCK